MREYTFVMTTSVTNPLLVTDGNAPPPGSEADILPSTKPYSYAHALSIILAAP